MTKIALYLAGGGARGAYQAGALKAISTILNSKKFLLICSLEQASAVLMPPC